MVDVVHFETPIIPEMSQATFHKKLKYQQCISENHGQSEMSLNFSTNILVDGLHLETPIIPGMSQAITHKKTVVLTMHTIKPWPT